MFLEVRALFMIFYTECLRWSTMSQFFKLQYSTSLMQKCIVCSIKFITCLMSWQSIDCTFVELQFLCYMWILNIQLTTFIIPLQFIARGTISNGLFMCGWVRVCNTELTSTPQTTFFLKLYWDHASNVVSLLSGEEDGSNGQGQCRDSLKKKFI